MSGKSTNGESGRKQERSKYSAPVRKLPNERRKPEGHSANPLDLSSLGAAFYQSLSRPTLATSSSPTERSKFLSGSYELTVVHKNNFAVEAAQPTANFIYLAHSLNNGKSFGISVTKVVTEKCSDFSFIIGFTSCSPASVSNSKQHLTAQCYPTGCGGHSQQLKIFHANKLGTKVTVERHVDGQIYFAIDNSMPIRIQFDRNSCGIDLVKQHMLTPYIQLSGNVLALMAGSNIRKLNIRSAMSLGTATAYGPPIHIQTSATHVNEAHQAFVAPSDVDIKFIQLKHPQNDVKVSVNRLAVLRKNERGEKFVFYIDKIFNVNARVTVQVTKIYEADKYTSDFEFGIMTVRSDYMKMMENEFFMDSRSVVVQNASHCFKINRNSKVNDEYTFTRTGNDMIEIKKNGSVHKMWKIGSKFAQAKSLLPLFILNGSVSGLIIVNNDTSIKFDQTFEWPALEIKTTENVQLTNETLLTWSQNGVDGVVVNAKTFDSMIRFIIREIQASTNGKSMTLGLINSTKIGFKTLRDMTTCLDFKHDNLIPLPAVGLKFSLYKTPYGKVTLKCESDQHSETTTLFTVEPKYCYYPILIFNGSVIAVELLPNPSKTLTVKQVTGAAAPSCPQPFSAPADDCKICMDRTINSVFVPCGHRFACHDCAKEWMRNIDKHCPVCRQKIDILVKTFD